MLHACSTICMSINIYILTTHAPSLPHSLRSSLSSRSVEELVFLKLNWNDGLYQVNYHDWLKREKLRKKQQQEQRRRALGGGGAPAAPIEREGEEVEDVDQEEGAGWDSEGEFDYINEEEAEAAEFEERFLHGVGEKNTAEDEGQEDLPGITDEFDWLMDDLFGGEGELIDDDLLFDWIKTM